MNNLICPISDAQVDRTVVRLTGFITALFIALFIYTNNVVFITVVTVDFFIRAFTPLNYSYISWTACQISRLLHLPKYKINKAPKIFAARVGFLFALATHILFYIHPLAAVITGIILMSFALIESLLNFCFGCAVYTYIVLPIYKKS